MKKAHIKCIVSVLVLLIALCMMIPKSYAEEGPKIYSFYSVSNGENLNGKKFIILSSFRETNSPKGNGIDKSFTKASPIYDGNLIISPILGTNSDDYIYGRYTPVQQGTCFGSSYLEWCFEKNSDGTYSIYLAMTAQDVYGPKAYLASDGNNDFLTISDFAKGKFEIEYKDGGKIALKLVGYEIDTDNIRSSSLPTINPDYSYVAYNPDGGYFYSGTSGDIVTLELYQLNQKGIVMYEYDTYEMYDGYWGNEPGMDNNVQFVDTNEEALYEVGNTSSNGAFNVFLDTDKTYLSDLFAKGEEDPESFKDSSPKSSKLWGMEYQLVGWGANTVRGEQVVIGLDAKLKYEKSTGTIKTKDIDGNEVALSSPAVLYGLYDIKSENIFFNIKYTEELNLNDGSLITEEVDTEALAVGHVYYKSDPKQVLERIKYFIVDTEKNVQTKGPKRGPAKGPDDGPLDGIDNISKLLVTSYNPAANEIQIVIEGFMEVDPETHERISYTPVSGKSLSDIVDHVLEYITKYSDELDVADADNINECDVVWYENEYDDVGIMIRGVMRDMKNFLVIDASFEDLPQDQIPVDYFKIEILNEDGDLLKTLKLTDDDVEVSADKKTYTWKMNDMTEDTYTVKQFNRNAGKYVPTTSASSDANTNMGTVSEDPDSDVVTLKVSTVNNKKDRVSLVNKYTSVDEPEQGQGGQNPSPAPGGSGAPAAGGGGGPVAQAIQNIYNGLLPKTGSASAFIITVIGIVLIAIAIRLRNGKSKTRKRK